MQRQLQDQSAALEKDTKAISSIFVSPETDNSASKTLRSL